LNVVFDYVAKSGKERYIASVTTSTSASTADHGRKLASGEYDRRSGLRRQFP
jgi:hypothetical protein